MNANRTKPGRGHRARDLRAEPDDDNAGSGTRRRSSQPNQPSVPPRAGASGYAPLPAPSHQRAPLPAPTAHALGRVALSAQRGARAPNPPPAPDVLDDALDDPPTASRAEAEELETRIFMLLTKLEAEDGMVLPPGPWVAVADLAKRRGLIEEHGLRLYLKKRGRQELERRATPHGRQTTMTKIYPPDRLLLKDLSHETGVPMQDAIGLVVAAVYEHRDALTRVARGAGLEHPWEGIGALLKSGARK